MSGANRNAPRSSLHVVSLEYLRRPLAYQQAQCDEWFCESTAQTGSGFRLRSNKY
jgi:hypothetical protein